jgi:phospholipase C
MSGVTVALRRSVVLVGAVAAVGGSLVLVALGSSLAACSKSAADTAACVDPDGGYEPDGEVATPCAWNASVTRPDESTAQSSRAACAYGRGDMPAATLGPSFPVGTDMPIDNIVVLMMENHSFDSYLGHLNQYANRTDVESAPASASNPGVDGGTVPWTHAPHPCSADTDHSWKGTRLEIDDGAMDGFVRDNEGFQQPGDAGAVLPLYDGARSMWWYDQTDLPLYYQLASTFAVADHYHCAVPGPTWPNRMFLFAATSYGETDSVWPDLTSYVFPIHDASILDELEKKHVTWGLYADGEPGAAILYGIQTSIRWGRPVVQNIAQFTTDAAAGNLPQVTFVDPNFNTESNGGAATDEHPPGDIQSGEAFVAQIVQSVVSGPQWPHTALFITHDENGGFYDHVPPPSVCAPDSIAPILDPGDTTMGGFDLDGMRVVLIAVSPYARPGYVGHQVYDHTSLTRFIEARFGIPAVTKRDANAIPPTDLFDFSDPPALLTPPVVTVPPVDATQLQYCETTFGN